MLGLGNGLTGGIASAWTPADIGSLLHWYRKGIGQGSDTGDANRNCSVWSDQKGTNRLTSTGDDDNLSPTLNTDGTITFDSASDIMQFESEISLGTFSVYVKISYSDAINGDYLFEKFGSSQDYLQLATEALVKVRINNNGRHDYLIDPVLPEDGTPFNIGFERVEGAGRNVYVYSGVGGDGESQALTGGKDGIEVITELLEIGSIGKPVQTSTWHEIVICNDALSIADRKLLFTYLDSI
tara:strand:- start:253 stop:972 length:720 start_codon:yes stop_codon:yes gene_type:complete